MVDVMESVDGIIVGVAVAGPDMVDRTAMLW